MPLTTLVDRLRDMEARGHARRLPNAADRRSHIVVLTAAGLAAHAATGRLFEIAQGAVAAALPGLEAEVRDELRRLRAAVDEARLVGPVSPRRWADRAG